MCVRFRVRAPCVRARGLKGRGGGRAVKMNAPVVVVGRVGAAWTARAC